MDSQDGSNRYGFDDFELDARTLELFKNGQPVRIQRQPAQVLALLVERAGELVSRDELRDRIWGGDRFVDFDRSLAYCLHQIRAALGDDSREPRFVETLRGLGYRFVGRLTRRAAIDRPVAVDHQEAMDHPEASVVPAPTRPRRAARRVAIAATIVLAATAGALWLSGTGRADSSQPGSVLSAEEVMLQRAAEYYRRGRRDDVMNALAVYRELVAVSPDSPRARAGAANAMGWLAAHHRSAREAQAALSAALEAARMAPDDPEVVAAHAWGLHVSGRFTEAAELYRAALRLDPSRRDLLGRLAMLEHQRGRLDEAVRLLDASWRSGEPDPAPAGLLGVVLNELGFETEARDWNRLAISLAPDHPQSTYFEGLMAYRAGRLEEAETRLAAAAAAPDPGALMSVLHAVVVALRHGAAAAVAPLEGAAHAMPEATDVLTLLGEVYAAVDRPDDARRTRARVIEICRQGFEAAPEAPMWPRCLATQASVAGDGEGLVLWYGRAVERGWRKLISDRGDGALTRVAHDPRVQAIQKRMADDIDRMRRLVERRGVPKAVIGQSVDRSIARSIQR
jgi:DNA-binding winged helix-turn-helix (wHTH) protein/Flp pilus assembly protein TadD